MRRNVLNMVALVLTVMLAGHTYQVKVERGANVMTLWVEEMETSMAVSEHKTVGTRRWIKWLPECKDPIIRCRRNDPDAPRPEFKCFGAVNADRNSSAYAE